MYYDSTDNKMIDYGNIDVKCVRERNMTSYIVGRKKAANDMSDNADLPFHHLVFCYGWIVNNLHTAFDYIFNSDRKDRVAAKVLAGWGGKDTYGGVSPSFEDITTEKEKAEELME